ncbi:Neutral cholesterol ester hydrolase 1 [Holothuria leucospilota]|uniref:Neutral cholesterol ester hydrolase 1 n=1 Tax=Holothuria leucospilota TaxID=206669 RepID=A0A9Q1BPT3_HOLLE|nr:Neutral cholesterol ester hydrolase 1 [Holothuria leucospilota]
MNKFYIILPLLLALLVYNLNPSVPNGLEEKWKYQILMIFLKIVGSVGKFIGMFESGDDKLHNTLIGMNSVASFVSELYATDHFGPGVITSEADFNGTKVYIYQPPVTSDQLLSGFVYFRGGGLLYGNSKSFEGIAKKIAFRVNTVVINVELQPPETHNPADPVVPVGVVNHSSQPLTPDELCLLSRGLKFCPVPLKLEKLSLQQDLDAFFRRLRLCEYFSGDGADISYDPDTFDQKFKDKSTWTPPTGRDPHLESFIHAVQKEIDEFVPCKFVKDILTRGERKALAKLKQRSDLVIKPEDKGPAFVVQDRSDYIETASEELSNKNVYLESERDLTRDTQGHVREVVQSMLAAGEIDEKVAKYLTPSDTKTSRFYTLPKTHKAADAEGRLKTRPVISGSGSPIERLSEFVDFFINPAMQNLDSYIRDTKHVLNIIKEINDSGPLPQGTMMFTIDVKSMYPSMPRSLGVEAVKRALEERETKIPSTENILRCLDICLRENNFEFNGRHFTQIHGTSIGPKMAPGYACLGMGLFEEELKSKLHPNHRVGNYTNTNYNKFPGPVNQAFGAVKWFMSHAEEYGVDPNRIAVGGDSAGGYLSTVISHLVHDDKSIPNLKLQILIYPWLQCLDFHMPSYQKYAADFGINTGFVNRQSMAIICSFHAWGITNLRLIQKLIENKHVSPSFRKSALYRKTFGHDLLPAAYRDNSYFKGASLPDDGDEDFWDESKEIFLDPRFTPQLRKNMTGLPTAYVMTVGYDSLRDEGYLYVQQLKRAGVNVTWAHYERGWHGIHWTKAGFTFRLQEKVHDDFLMFVRNNL